MTCCIKTSRKPSDVLWMFICRQTGFQHFHLYEHWIIVDVWKYRKFDTCVNVKILNGEMLPNKRALLMAAVTSDIRRQRSKDRSD